MDSKDTALHGLLMIFCTLITAVGAQISFKVGPVPYTFQNYGLILAGLMLRPKCALMSQLLYILLIELGLPIAAGFRGGPYILVGHTSGYIWMFPVTSCIMSIISHTYLRTRGKDLDSIGRFDIMVLLLVSFISALPLYIVGGLVFIIYSTPVALSDDFVHTLRILLEHSLILNIPFIPQDLLMDHLIAIITAKHICRLLRVRGMIV